MPLKILITGGAGYIGSVLTPALLENGFQVTVLDNFMFGQSSLAECCIHPRFQIVRGDARDPQVLKPLVKDADLIIPLAALVGAPICKNDAVGARTINLEAIRQLLELTSLSQKIIYPTTNSGYGIGERGKFCDENSPLRPLSLYGETKVEAERLILERGEAVTFRLATVFGMSSRMRTDLLVNDFIHRAVTDRCVVVFEGHFKRNYIHIRDVARVFQHGIENFERMKDQPYNVGLSDANLSKLELCALIQQQVPEFVCLEAPIGKDPDQRDYMVSNAKIEATGFRPQYSLQDGILELIKGFRILRNAKYGNV